MNTKEDPIVSFLKEVMRRRKRLPSQMAADLGISHATVSRWLSGADIPSTKSCRKLAEYSGVALEKVLSLVGHLPHAPDILPSGRRYGNRRRSLTTFQGFLDMTGCRVGEKIEGEFPVYVVDGRSPGDVYSGGRESQGVLLRDQPFSETFQIQFIRC